MPKRPSILFLMPYFGQWPFWMPLFLKSCELNPDINWLLIGDCGAPEGLPSNVEYRSSSFDEYCHWVSSRLGWEFRPESAYKLCDLRPAYGFIHEVDIEGYDYWAFGDLDLFYGDLRSYFTDAKLTRLSFFSTHERRVAGHLCLIRNSREFRELFRLIPRFRERVQDQRHHALDEGAFSRLFLWRKNFPKPLFKLVGRFNPLRRKAEFQEAFSTPNGCIPWTDGSFNFPERWFWKQGRLSNDKDHGRHFPYFHFAEWKRADWKDIDLPAPKQIAEYAASGEWTIDRTGIHPGEK